MTPPSRHFQAAAKTAALAADDKKAEDVVLLDVRRFSGLADFYLLASAGSSPQLQAVADHIEENLKERHALSPIRRDGSGSVTWKVLDYGGLVVHLMHSSTRAFYGLERLWDGARPVSWQNVPARSGKRPDRRRPGAPRRRTPKKR